ncbi:unnamed protein product [Schistosoma curassoni]|uniref:Uncharacterized protein n=1 Tax=Schistosoma curassoni TaxID=6186 RepID=A0A183KWB9_9TREM|nr:unnamed protein product [Schistosoma curassoni]
MSWICTAEESRKRTKRSSIASRCEVTDRQSKTGISTIEENLQIKTTVCQPTSKSQFSIQISTQFYYETHHPEHTSVYLQLSTQYTSDQLAGHYQQQLTVGENKSDPSGGRHHEEVLGVDRTHIEESTQLHHKAIPHMESSRSKEETKTREYITSRNGERHEKNEQELDRTRKEDSEQSGLENAGCWPLLYRE